MDQQTLILVTKGYRIQRAKRRARRRALVLGATATGAFVAGRRSAQRRQAVEKRRIKPSRRTRRLLAVTAILGGSGAIWAAQKHPRGPKGRFRETPDLLEHAGGRLFRVRSESLAQNDADFRAFAQRHSHVDWRLDGMSLAGRRSVMDSFDRFAQDYPATAQRIRLVHHDPSLEGVGMAYASPDAESLKFGILLRESDSAGHTMFARSRLHWSVSSLERENEHPLGVTMTHELGHVLAFHGESGALWKARSTGIAPGRMDYNRAARNPASLPSLDAAYRMALKRYRDFGWGNNDPAAMAERIHLQHPAVSKYALEDKGEFFAENFAAWRHPKLRLGALISHRDVALWANHYRDQTLEFEARWGSSISKGTSDMLRNADWIPLCDGHPVFDEDGPQDIIDLVAKVIRKPAAKKTSKPSSKVAKVSFRQHRQRKDAAAKSRNARRRRSYATGLAAAGLLTSAKLIESPSARTGLKDSIRHPERGARRVKAGAQAAGETAHPEHLKRAGIIAVRQARRSRRDGRERGVRKPWVADGIMASERYLTSRYKHRYRRRANDIAGRAKPRGEVKKMVDGGPAALHVNGPLKIRRKRKGKQESIIVGARVQKLKPVKGRRLTAAQHQQRVNAGKASAAKRKGSVADKPSSSRGRREYDEKAAFRRTLHRVALYGGVAAATGALSRSGDFRQAPYADDDSLEFRVGFGERNRGLRVYRRPAGYGRRTYGRSPIVERKRLKVEMDNRDGVSRAVYVSVPNPIKLRKVLADIQQTQDTGIIAKHPGHDQREHGMRHGQDRGRKTVGRKRANRGGRNVQGSDPMGRYTTRSRKRNRRHAVRVLGGIALAGGVGLGVGGHVSQRKEINRLHAEQKANHEADQAFRRIVEANFPGVTYGSDVAPTRRDAKRQVKASRKR